ncbi:MAG: TonB-dependent receptor [Thermoanaerobaculia bacterium]
MRIPLPSLRVLLPPLSALAIAAVALVPPTAAQSATAALRGKVADEQGGALAGAAVTARNVETNVSWSVSSNSLGRYYIPNLPASRYELEASLEGFATGKREGLVLRVGQEATVDFALQVGVTEELTVLADAPILETTRSTVGTIIDKDQIDQLPLIERDFSSLAKLSPGVTEGSGGNGPGLSVNGQTSFSNGYYVDGANAEWNYYGNQSSTFVQDWVQEFQVMTNSYPAEFGTASGGIINAITRRGGNELHGRVYGFFRDDSWDAEPFAGHFENGEPVYLTEDETPPLSQERYGAFLSGPIKRDKLFYFLGYERLVKDSSEVLGISDYWRARGVETVLPVEGRNDPFIAKLDASIGDRNHVSLRYDRSDRTDTNQVQFGGALATEEVRHTFGGPIWNAVGSWTSTFGGSRFNEFRAAFGSNKPPIICNKSGTGGRDNLRERPGTYSIQIYPGAVFGCPIFTGLEGEENLQLMDTFSFYTGAHQVKVGAQAFRINTIVDVTNFHDGFWIFLNDRAFDIDDPATYPFIFAGNVGVIDVDISSWNYHAFVQDTWQVSDDLTINLGLRYDLDGSVTQGNELVDRKNAQLVERYGGSPPLEKTEKDTDNFAPRLGLVWTPTADKRTAVRAAAGRFFDQNHTNFNGIYYANTLLAEEFNILDAFDPFSWGPFGSPDALRRFLAESFPFFPDLSQALTASQIINRLDPNLQTARTDQFTVGVSHDFGHGLSVDADFVHARGEDIPMYVEENVALVDGVYVQPDPRFSTIATLKNVGSSEYNGLLTEVRYRRERLDAGLSYTLSEATSNVVTGIFGGQPTNSLDLSEDEGPDNTDRRHNVVLNANYRLPLGFELGAIWIYRSASPYSVTTALQLDDDPFPDRPERRNSRRGDSFSSVDLRLSKAFRAGDRLRFTVFWEMYNAFDTDNFTGYVGGLESPLFGMPTAAFEKRRQQLGVRVDF